PLLKEIGRFNQFLDSGVDIRARFSSLHEQVGECRILFMVAEVAHQTIREDKATRHRCLTELQRTAHSEVIALLLSQSNQVERVLLCLERRSDLNQMAKHGTSV